MKEQKLEPENPPTTPAQYLKLQIHNYEAISKRSIYYDLSDEIKIRLKNPRNLRQKIDRINEGEKHHYKLMNDHSLLFDLLSKLGITYENLMTMGSIDTVSPELYRLNKIEEKINNLLTHQIEVRESLQRKMNRSRIDNKKKGNIFFSTLFIAILSFNEIYAKLKNNLYPKLNDINFENCADRFKNQFWIMPLNNNYSNEDLFNICMGTICMQAKVNLIGLCTINFHETCEFLLKEDINISNNFLINYRMLVKKALIEKTLPIEIEPLLFYEIKSILLLDFILIELTLKFLGCYKLSGKSPFFHFPQEFKMDDQGKLLLIDKNYYEQFVLCLKTTRKHFVKFFYFFQNVNETDSFDTTAFNDVVNHYSSTCKFLFDAFINMYNKWVFLKNANFTFTPEKKIKDTSIPLVKREKVKNIDPVLNYQLPKVIIDKYIEDTEISLKQLIDKFCVTKR